MKKNIIMSSLLILLTSLSLNANEEINVKNCLACHGQNFEKKALNQSKIVSELSEDEILMSLKGYRDGTYGGKMKMLMKGQLTKYNDLESLAKYLHTNYSVIEKTNLSDAEDQNKTQAID